jgi:hypothetical protein
MLAALDEGCLLLVVIGHGIGQHGKIMRTIRIMIPTDAFDKHG